MPTLSLRAITAVAAVAVLAHPLVTWWALERGDVRAAAVLLIAIAALLGARRQHRTTHDGTLGGRAAAVAMATLGALALLLNDYRYVLASPVLINLALLGLFANSLRADATIIESIARLQDRNLTLGQIAYCRSVTVAWCIFFVLNGTLAAALALSQRIEWWAIYTGVVAHVLVALLFAVEYLIRTIRFPHVTLLGLALFATNRVGRRPADHPTAGTTTTDTGDPAPERALERQISVTLPRTHPAFRGHFPGRPIFPAVSLLIELVVPIVEELGYDSWRLQSASRLKFCRSIGPDQPLDVSVQIYARTGRVQFEIRGQGVLCARGLLLFVT